MRQIYLDAYLKADTVLWQAEFAESEGALKMQAVSFEQSLTHHELITKAFEMVRQGELGPYETFQLSVSSFENPIQIVLRHNDTGRLKIANINRLDGAISWDTEVIPWN